MRKDSEYAEVVARRLGELRAEMGGASDPPGGDDSWQPSWWADPGGPDEEGEGTAEIAAVPVPGRHASRRQVVISPDAVLPEPLRGRVALSPWHLAVLVGVVAVGLAATCWWLLRSGPEPVSAPAKAPPVSSSPAALVSLPAAAASGAAATPSGAVSAGTVTVDVEGKVRKPGIVVLPTGSRVVDAIRSAGGATARELSGLNQAAVLTDGQQIVVGAPGGAGAAVPGASGASPPSGGTAAAGAPGAPVSLNSATLEQLDSLPGVGPVTAQSILDWRTQNGAFTSLDELLEVDGIGPKTLEKLKPMVTL